MIKQIPPTPVRPDGKVWYATLNPEQLADTEHMGEDARKAYKAKVAEDPLTQGQSQGAKKAREVIRAEIMEETKLSEGLLEKQKHAAATARYSSHNNVNCNELPSVHAYRARHVALAFVGFTNNRDAVFRGTDGKDVVHPAGTFVTRKKPGTSSGDMLFMPSNIIAATKHLTEENRSAAHQAFAEQAWAREDEGERTEAKVEYQKQQMVKIEKIGSKIAAKVEEAEPSKVTKKG